MRIYQFTNGETVIVCSGHSETEAREAAKRWAGGISISDAAAIVTDRNTWRCTPVPIETLFVQYRLTQ